MKIYRIYKASKYLGAHINTLRTIANNGEEKLSLKNEINKSNGI